MKITIEKVEGGYIIERTLLGGSLQSALGMQFGRNSLKTVVATFGGLVDCLGNHFTENEQTAEMAGQDMPE